MKKNYPLQSYCLNRLQPFVDFRYLAILILSCLSPTISLFSQATIDLSKPVGSSKGSGGSNGAGGVTYNIPIDVLPGVNGMQPNVSLSYSSQGGDGNFGWGWNLSAYSSISRAGKNNYYNGIAAPVSYTNTNDAFVLDGQRLFPTSGINGDNGTIYGTENEGFTKIESFGGSSTSGPDWFRVTTKDGKIMEYGHASNTTLLTDNYQSTMLWLLNKVTDINDNYQTFQYSVNNTDRNFALTEINYTGNTAAPILPNTRITFTYNVKPNWQKTKMYQSGASVASPFILTGISVINPGATTVKSYQCAYSTVRDQYFLTSFMETGANGTSLNPLTFTYGSNMGAADVGVSPSYGAFTYNNTFTGDITGDGKEDIVAAYFQYDNNGIPKYKEYAVFDEFSTYNGGASLSIAYHYDIPTWGTTNRLGQLVRYFGGYYSFLTSDYDGDTKRDVLMSNWTISGADMIFNDISINYSRYYGAIVGHLPRTQPYSNVPQAFPYSSSFKYAYRNGSTYGTNLIPGDFDGDGAQDYILILGINSSNAFKAFFSSPQKGIVNEEILNFGVEGSSSDPFYANSVASATDVAPIDFNGDGKTEILVQKASQSYVLSVFPISATTGYNWSATILHTTTAIRSGYRVFPGDFNGDGATDLLVRSSKTNEYEPWNFLYSTGTQFRSFPFLYAFRPTLDGDNGASSNANMLMVGDFNGDGKSDVWQSLDVATPSFHSKHVLYYSNGIPVDGGNSTSVFTVEIYTRPESINKSPIAQSIVGDINGDGKADLMSLLNSTSRIIYPKPFKEERLMTSATDGYGSVTSFGYGLMNSSYQYQRSSNYEYDNSSTPIGQGENGNPYNVLKAPMYLLTDITAPNGIGGTTYATYDYKDAVYSPIRGFLGFKQVSEYSPNGTSTSFSEIEPSLLVPHTVRQLSMYGADMLSDTKITDQFLRPGTSYFDKRYVHHINSTLTLNGLTGSAMESANTYDSYGNITDNTTKKGYMSGTTIIPEETTVTNTVYGMHNTPVPARPESVTVSNTRIGQSMVTKTSTNTFTSAGLLSSTTDFAGTAVAVTSSYTYDNFGNVATISVNAPGTLTPTVTNSYDNTGRFLTQKETTAGGIIKRETYTYEPIWGLPATIVASDGLTKGYTYDNSFGRPLQSILPDGNSITQTMTWETSGNSRYSIAAQRDADGGLYTKEYYDMEDRKIMTEKGGFNGQLLTSVTNYDYRGEVASQTAPYYPGETPVTTTNSYDGYGRPTGTSNGTSSVAITYNNHLGGGLYQMTTTNGAGQATTKTQDAAGRVIHSNDNGGDLHYNYDSWGNQYSVALGPHTLVSNVYDAYGRKISLTDNNAGTITYAYDALGKPTQQTDANGNTYTMLYDGFGRTVSKTGPEGTTSYEYYTNGSLNSDHPTRITGPAGDITEYIYDALMRKDKQITTVDGTNYVDRYEYDSYCNLVKTTYASGVIIHDSYDNNNIPINTTLEDGGISRNIFTATTMNSKGIYTGYTLGNGISSQIDYDPALGVPTRYHTPGLQDLNMVWDAQRGNLSSRNDGIRGLTETFIYDNLNRLTSATINGVTQLTIGYDNGGYSLGNITSKSDAGDYTYSTNKINAVAFISNPAGPQVPPSVISTQTQQLTYTPFLKTASIEQNGYRLDYTYGSDQQRIKGVLQQSGATIDTKYYLGTYERQITLGVNRYIHYINAGNGLAAIAVKENGITNVYYAYSDHLGSILTLTDVNGTVVANQNFDAWGRYRNPNDWTYNSIPTNPTWLYRGFTGHEHLNGFALVNMNGRMYDPVLGKMLSPDNYVPLPWNTQGYNRYSYANNNPLVHVDPDGNLFWFVIGAAALIGGITNGISAKNNGGHFLDGFWKGAVIGGASAAIGFGVGGAIATGLGGVWGGVVGTTLGGGVGGGINGFGMALSNGGDLLKGFGNGFASGLVAGAVGSGLGAIAPSFSNSSLAGRYIGKALYAGLTGAATAGAGMFTSDLIDNGRIDLSGSDYLKGIGTGAGLGAGMSLGYSAYDYVTWDRYSGAEKTAMLNREFKTNVLQYDPNEADYGGYDWGTYDIMLGKKALANRAIARNTVSHEFQHYIDFHTGVPFNRNNLEHTAHLLDLRLTPSQGLPGRYWTESRWFLQNEYNYRGSIPHTYGPGQIWFNIFR